MRHDPSRLVDILIAARDAVKFTEGMTPEQFGEDNLHQYATTKALETIGGAVARLRDGTKARYPEVEWDKVAGMHSRLMRDDFSVRHGHIWSIVQDDLPGLVSQMEAIVPPAPD
ncbi:MAG: DUF86 domain-containing protein [Gammaproteobacteria bacterium]|nr:DUF86 domain-containing protein [Gammaproteobacteria bacterium]